MNYTDSHSGKRLSALLLVVTLTAGSISAQTADPKPATPAPAPAPATTDTATPAPTTDSSVTMLEKFTVSDVPIDKQILPTVRPIGSVMGDDRSILDTPRSVTSVNKAWMDERQVKDAMDFGQFSPGVYSAAQYGVPATPQIRGDLGEIYFNGQGTKYSRNSVLPSFNGVEAMDIVKGPGSAVYGPQGQGPGGYVNLVSKKPYFDGEHTDISATLGYWTSGRTYSNPELQIDTSAPLSKTLAYRVSYLSRYGEGYYLNTKNETQDIYAALTYKPSDNITFEWFGQFYANRFNEISGVNRVTQNFIDNQIYVAGPVSSEYEGLINPATAHLVKIYPYQALVGPSDSNRSKRFQTQLITTAYLGGDAKIVNLTYFETRDSRKWELYAYDEYVPNDWSIDNRTQYENSFTMFGLKSKINTGIDLKFQRLTSYSDFSIEPFSYYDLTQGGDSLILPQFLATHTFGGDPIPNKGNYSANPFPDPGTQDSKIFDAAAFYQQDIQFTSQWSAVIGGRLDRLHASAANPALVGVPYGAFYNAVGTVTDPSVFTSLIFKANENSSLYFTFDRTYAVLGSANFGGVSGTGGDPGIKESLKTESKLYEFGYKASLFKNTLYASVAAFQQYRTAPQLEGPNVLIRTNGLEAEAVYQPTKKLAFNVNATYQDATAYSTFFYEQTGSYLDLYPVGYIVDGKSGTGVGSPNYSGYAPATGKARAPGVPQFMANAFLSYGITDHFGFGTGPQINGRQNANAEGTLHIPFQYQMNGYLYYRTKGWDVQLSVKNMFNHRLFDPVDVSFAGNDVVYYRAPISASITVRYHF
jgi:hypothetical protein